MTYSFTQISQYISCPRRYHYRYLEGWREKDTRAAMLFGRAFERALSAYFRREDSAAVLFGEWAAHKNTPLEYSNGTSWDRMLQQGIQLLERFAQDDRVRVRDPAKISRSSSRGRSPKETTSSLISTRLGISTVPAACSSGRQRPPAIPSNRTIC